MAEYPPNQSGQPYQSGQNNQTDKQSQPGQPSQQASQPGPPQLGRQGQPSQPSQQAYLGQPGSQRTSREGQPYQLGYPGQPGQSFHRDQSERGYQQGRPGFDHSRDEPYQLYQNSQPVQDDQVSSHGKMKKFVVIGVVTVAILLALVWYSRRVVGVVVGPGEVNPILGVWVFDFEKSPMFSGLPSAEELSMEIEFTETEVLFKSEDTVITRGLVQYRKEGGDWYLHSGPNWEEKEKIQIIGDNEAILYTGTEVAAYLNRIPSSTP